MLFRAGLQTNKKTLENKAKSLIDAKWKGIYMFKTTCDLLWRSLSHFSFFSIVRLVCNPDIYRSSRETNISIFSKNLLHLFIHTMLHIYKSKAKLTNTKFFFYIYIFFSFLPLTCNNIYPKLVPIQRNVNQLLKN